MTKLIVSFRNLEDTPINKSQVTKYGDGYMLPDKYNNSKIMQSSTQSTAKDFSRFQSV